MKYLERMTVDKAENVIWVEERLTRLTASKFGDVFCLKKVSSINPEASLKRIMYSQVSNKECTAAENKKLRNN